MTFIPPLNRHFKTPRSGNALEFASTSLRADKMVVLTAVRENKGAMAYASKEIFGKGKGRKWVGKPSKTRGVGVFPPKWMVKIMGKTDLFLWMMK